MRALSSQRAVLLAGALVLSIASCGLNRGGLGSVDVDRPDGGADGGGDGTGGRGGSGGGIVTTGGGGATGGDGGDGGDGAGGGGAQPDAGVVNDAGDPTDVSATPDARPPSLAGCADGTREGYVDTVKYPGIAACAGGWSIPGVIAESTRTPACARRGGNTGTGTVTDGAGCSVADLCAEGWHVCETAAEVEARGTDCTDALDNSNNDGTFYVTRQRGMGVGLPTCRAANDMGANNIHGCTRDGLVALPSCSPFEFSWSHDECDDNPPWACGVSLTDINEAHEVTKSGPARGGALCCQN